MGAKNLIYTEKKIHFKEGDIIFKEDDEGAKEMYFIDSGRVKIVKKVGDTDATLAILDEGDFFGEMTLITGSRRVASAIAFTDCNLHVMDKEAFMSNIANNRDFVSRILVTLVHRLEGTDLSFTLLFKLISKSSKP